MQVEEPISYVENQEDSESWFWVPEWNLSDLWNQLVEEYGFIVEPFTDFVFSFYESLDIVNAIMLIMKVVPAFICMFQIVRNIYVPSRERIKQKQLELEDLQLQVDILNRKLSVQDSELDELESEICRAGERLLEARARARDAIIADEELRRAVYEDRDSEEGEIKTDDCEFLLQLIKQYKYDTEDLSNKMDCGERNESADSVYSSLEEFEQNQECRVKIVKVTNVYKVACLRNYIKHRRRKRNTKQADLKKKVESISKLLEYWQQTLNLVSHSRLLIPKTETSDMTSQDGMGDYRHSLRGSSGSESDLRNNEIDKYAADWQTYRGYYTEDAQGNDCHGAPYMQSRHRYLTDLPEESPSELQMAIEVKNEEGQQGGQF